MALFTAILKTSVILMLPTGLAALFVAALFEFSFSESVTPKTLMYFSIALPISVASVGVSAVLCQEESEEMEALLDKIWHKDFS